MVDELADTATLSHERTKAPKVGVVAVDGVGASDTDAGEDLGSSLARGIPRAIDAHIHDMFPGFRVVVDFGILEDPTRAKIFRGRGLENLTTEFPIEEIF